MRGIITGIVISFLSIQLIAQNLVSNPGFEDNTGCPERNGDIKKCISWSSTAPSSTPDYFNSCFLKSKNSTVEVGVPSNSEGKRNPVQGEAYMGLALFFKKNYFLREYIQNSLQKPLEKGLKYKISFYISLSDSSEFISDHIAISFSSVPNGMLANAPEILQTARHLVTIKNQEALSARKWTKVEANYIAYGGEEYLIIGSFRANMTKKEFKQKMKRPALRCNNNECGAYYYIDEVSLVEVANEKVNPRFK